MEANKKFELTVTHGPRLAAAQGYVVGGSTSR
jgi:hypothetical protein